MPLQYFQGILGDWIEVTNSATTTTTNLPFYTTTTSTISNTTMITQDEWAGWYNQVRIIRQEKAWTKWTNGNYVQQAVYQAQPPEPKVLTAAEIAARDAAIAAEEVRMKVWRQEESRRRRIQEEANQRAEELLLSYLTPEQVDEYRRVKRIHVCTKSGRTYRINCAGMLSGNIDVVDAKGKAIERLCAHAAHHEYPLGDHLLTQVLHLRHAEADFRRIANRHPVN